MSTKVTVGQIVSVKRVVDEPMVTHDFRPYYILACTRNDYENDATDAQRSEIAKM